MAMEAPQPPRSGADASSPADRLRERVAEARASISESLREVVEGLEHEEAEARGRADQRIDSLVAERLAAAEREMHARVDLRVAHAREELENGLSARVDDYLAKAEASLAEATDRSARGLTEQRTELDQRFVGLRAESQQQGAEATQKLEHGLGARVDDHLAKAEAALREATDRAARELAEQRTELDQRFAALRAESEQRMAESARLTREEIESGLGARVDDHLLQAEASLREAIDRTARELAEQRAELDRRFAAARAESEQRAAQSGLVLEQDLTARVDDHLAKSESSHLERVDQATRDLVSQHASTTRADLERRFGELNVESTQRVSQAVDEVRSKTAATVATRLDQALAELTSRADADRGAHEAVIDELIARTQAERNTLQELAGGMVRGAEADRAAHQRALSELGARAESERRALEELTGNLRVWADADRGAHAQAISELGARAEADRQRLEEAFERTSTASLSEAAAEFALVGEQRAAAEQERLREASERTLATIGEAQAKVVGRLESAAEKLSLKSRRHELKLARQESTKRVEAALARLEQRVESAGSEIAVRADAERADLATGARALSAELQAQSDALKQGLGEQASALDGGVAQAGRDLEITRAGLAGARAELERSTAQNEERIETALTRLGEGVERVEGALAAIGESERSVIEAQERVGQTETRVAAVARTACEAADWEVRIHKAVDAEEDAARRIREAEQSLRDGLNGHSG
jgi:hypothetical protein